MVFQLSNLKTTLPQQTRSAALNIERILFCRGKSHFQHDWLVFAENITFSARQRILGALL